MVMFSNVFFSLDLKNNYNIYIFLSIKLNESMFLFQNICILLQLERKYIQWLAKAFIPHELFHILSHHNHKHKYISLELNVKDQHSDIQSWSGKKIIHACNYKWHYYNAIINACTNNVHEHFCLVRTEGPQSKGEIPPKVVETGRVRYCEPSVPTGQKCSCMLGKTCTISSKKYQVI